MEIACQIHASKLALVRRHIVEHMRRLTRCIWHQVVLDFFSRVLCQAQVMNEQSERWVNTWIGRVLEERGAEPSTGGNTHA